ncbi:MAG: ABC transporter ATP-binding protein [Planctomycetota bacterium]
MIEVKNLEMFYGHTHALKGVSFNVSKGEVVGLLGPNGAGKTTTMNILSTHIVPTSGSATVCGYDIREKPINVRKVTGYLPETAPLYSEMEVGEYLTFVGRGRGLNKKRLCERRDWVVETCRISNVFRSLVAELSRGYRQRVGLAQALIHDPEVLILDEPTSGLDPLQILEIRKLIRELAKEKTIIFSTHIMQEASAISDRIVIIDRGSIIAKGNITELQEKSAQNPKTYLSVMTQRPEVEEAVKKSIPYVNITFISEDEGVSNFELNSKSNKPLWQDLANLIKERGWLVRRVAEEKPSLEETFLMLTMRSHEKVITK